ncbi:MAG: hypothetical protein Q4G34_08705 [Micrococcus sp.]|nr:hypothetical protein [Micrococcus sp.]
MRHAALKTAGASLTALALAAGLAGCTSSGPKDVAWDPEALQTAMTAAVGEDATVETQAFADMPENAMEQARPGQYAYSEDCKAAWDFYEAEIADSTQGIVVGTQEREGGVMDRRLAIVAISDDTASAESARTAYTDMQTACDATDGEGDAQTTRTVDGQEARAQQASLTFGGETGVSINSFVVDSGNVSISIQDTQTSGEPVNLDTFADDAARLAEKILEELRG